LNCSDDSATDKKMRCSQLHSQNSGKKVLTIKNPKKIIYQTIYGHKINAYTASSTTSYTVSITNKLTNKPYRFASVMTTLQ